MTNSALHNFTTEQLLKELMRREKGASAPTQTFRNSDFTEFLFADGPDHTVSLIVSNDTPLLGDLNG